MWWRQQKVCAVSLSWSDRVAREQANDKPGNRCCRITRASLEVLNTAKQLLLKSTKMALKPMTIHVCVTATLIFVVQEMLVPNFKAKVTHASATTWMSFEFIDVKHFPLSNAVRYWYRLVSIAAFLRSSSKSRITKQLLMNAGFDQYSNRQCFLWRRSAWRSQAWVTPGRLGTSFLTWARNSRYHRRTDYMRDERKQKESRRSISVWSMMMPWALYGSDKPGYLFWHVASDLTEAVKGGDWKSFFRPGSKAPSLKGLWTTIHVKTLTDDQVAKQYGTKGLALGQWS